MSGENVHQGNSCLLLVHNFTQHVLLELYREVKDKACKTLYSDLDMRVSTRLVGQLFGFVRVHGVVRGVIFLSLQTLDPGPHSRLQSQSQALLHLWGCDCLIN